MLSIAILSISVPLQLVMFNFMLPLLIDDVDGDLKKQFIFHSWWVSEKDAWTCQKNNQLQGFWVNIFHIIQESPIYVLGTQTPFLEKL